MRRAWKGRFPAVRNALEVGFQERAPDGRRVRNGRPFELEVMGVCATCNGGWMATLDTEAERILFDLDGVRPMGLWSPSDLDVLSRWLVKLAVMRTLLDVEHVDHLRADLDSVRVGQSPTPQWSHFAGYVETSTWAHALTGFAPPPPKHRDLFGEPGAEMPTFMQASWAIGTLVFVSVRDTLPGHAMLEHFRDVNRSLGEPVSPFEAGPPSRPIPTAAILPLFQAFS